MSGRRHRGDHMADTNQPRGRRDGAGTLDRWPSWSPPSRSARPSAALLVNIFERKQEARNPFYRVVELTDDTEDPAIWGKNFPLQYDGYRRTVDQVRTRYRRQRGGAAHADAGRSALGRRAVAARGGPAAEDDVGRLRLLARTSARSAATPTCSTTRRSPSGSRSRSSRAPACTATPRSTCRTRSSAAATSSRASRR